MHKYDVIFSLGGNCSAAANLAQRGLRPLSLPFDWVYFKDESTIEYLINGIQTRFSDLMLKDNLIEILPGHPEWNESHKGFLKYLDTRSGYRFVNHFRKSITCEGEYDRVYKTLRRRIDRLFATIERGSRFLMVLASEVDVSETTVSRLLAAWRSAFPDKEFHIEFLKFADEEDSVKEQQDGLTIRRIRRPFNRYDCERTNFEWHFLDDVRSIVKPSRSRVAFHLLPHLRVEITWKRC